MSTPNTHHGAAAIEKMLKSAKGGPVFFCGAGGINMSSLAELTLLDGYSVRGSDRTESAATERLVSLGADIRIGHCAENLADCCAFVYTVAISPDNPEYVRASEMGIPMISRADFLGYAMTRRPHRIGISGTHGKSTCTAMCASVFAAARRDPVVMCGAEMIGDCSSGCSCIIGAGEDFIFEACEYMDSFLDFYPTVAVILNVEHDHVDYFKDMDQLRRSFLSFASIAGRSDGGCAVYNRDCAETVAALREYDGQRLPFGIGGGGEGFTAIELTETKGRYSFKVLLNDEYFASVTLSVPGRHNVYNALAAIAAGHIRGISPEDISRGLAQFRGTRRRMEYRGSRDGAEFYDDYAHHPTEIEASLRSARGFGSGRLVCLFQSHTYSRTASLIESFANALSLADRVLVAPIYSARETDTRGISQYRLAEAVNLIAESKKMGKIAVGCGDFDECIKLLLEDIRPDDTVIVMGAGDIYKIFGKIGLK